MANFNKVKLLLFIFFTQQYVKVEAFYLPGLAPVNYCKPTDQIANNCKVRWNFSIFCRNSVQIDQNSSLPSRRHQFGMSSAKIG